MRETQRPLSSGSLGSCAGIRSTAANLRRRVLRGLATLTLCIAAVGITPSPAPAQDPSAQAAGGKTQSAFPRQQGGPLGGPVQKLDKTQPMYLQGDELVYDNRNNRVTARGNVEIYYNNYVLLADQVIYDQNANLLYAMGNVRIKEPNGSVQSSDTMVLSDDFREGFINALSIVAKDDTRISADRAIRQDGNVTIYENGQMTPCKPCKEDPSKPPLWQIRAKRIIHNQAEGNLSYQDAQLEFFGMPVLLLPYFAHADPSVKRKSGFLMGDISHSADLGLTVEVPYYFALAPNYDFLFNPMYTAKQGVLWKGEWRHRLANGAYNIRFAGIHEEDPRTPHDWRGSIETKGLFQFGSWWNAGWDITIESDDTFRRYYKLDGILTTDRINQVNLQGIGDRSYFGAFLYHFGGLLITDTKESQAESRVMPSIDYNYILNQPVLGGELGFDASFYSLSRDQGTDVSRGIVEAKWRKQLIDRIGQVFTPFAHVRGDVYQTGNFNESVPGTTAENDAALRGLATGGLLYQYPWAAVTEHATHIFEPTAQFVVRPSGVSQNKVPNEDAKSLVFDDTLLFDIDKFSGYDRIETGIRANVGLQYTFQLHKGGFARAVVGQSLHLGGTNPFTNPDFDPTGKPSFTPGSGLETNRSDYVTGLYLAPTDAFRFIAQQRFDETSLAMRRQDVAARVSWGPVSATAGYAFTKADPLNGIPLNQREIIPSGEIKLTDHWSLLGSARYDLENSFLLMQTLGAKYQDECFMLTLSFTETNINDPTRDLKPDRSVMLRFELKHLGGYSSKATNVDTLLASPVSPPR